MAAAYIGGCLVWRLFGLIANCISTSLLPLYVGDLAVLIFFVCERLDRLEKL